MPLLDENEPNDLSRTTDVPKGFSVTPGAADLDDNGPDKPAWNWGPAFRQNNEVAAYLSSDSAKENNAPQDGFNSWEQIKGGPYEQFFEQLSVARNDRKFNAIKRDIDREIDDNKRLASQPWWMSLATAGTAGVLSPTSLLPGGTFVKGARGGIALVKAGLYAGAANAGAAAAQEVALHSIQQTRTVGESAEAIGASLFLGGLLGAGGQALLSKAEWQKGVAAIERDLGGTKLHEGPSTNQALADVVGRLQGEHANLSNQLNDTLERVGGDKTHPDVLKIVGEIDAKKVEVKSAEDALREADAAAAASGTAGTSVGAAVNAPKSLADNTIAGRAAQLVAAATAKLNPHLRILHSPSPVARQVYLDTFNPGVYLQQHYDGRNSGHPVAIYMKQYDNDLAEGLKAVDEGFKEHRKAGGSLSKDEFSEAVTKAMRRADEDVFDPTVTRTAQTIRAKTYDRLHNESTSLGMLKDVPVTEAASYLNRMWNARRISADEAGFKGMAEEYVTNKIQKEFATSVEAHGKRMARLDQEAADLVLTPNVRVVISKDIQAKLDALESANPDLTEVADRLPELRQRQIEARKDPNHPTGADAYREQIRALRAHGGDELKQFMAQRAALRSRKRNVDFGVAGLAERHDKVLAQLSDLEEANFREMERLVKKGQKLERDLDRLDADAYEARIDQLAQSYGSVAKKAEASAERAQKQIENIKKKAEQGKEKNRLEAERAATEASTGPPEEAAAKRAAAKEAADKTRAKDEARDAAVTKKLQAEAAKQLGLAERMNKISERLDIAKDFDHDGLMTEIKRAIDQATRETSARSLARGERAVRLGERAQQLNPQKATDRAKVVKQMQLEAEAAFISRWEVGRGAMDVDVAKRSAKFKEYARDVASEVFDQLTGRAHVAGRPEHITIKARGPLAERTFHIPDLFVGANGRAVEDYLENDVRQVMRRYVRVMSADVELFRKHGSVDMVDQIGKITEDYRKIREGVTDEKKLLELRKSEKQDIKDIEDGRDQLRNITPGAAVDSDFSRVVRAVGHLNYLRSMGEAALASLAETVRPAMVHGLMPYMSTMGQILTNLKGIRMSVKEAQLGGNVLEMVTGNRQATIHDIMDPYGSRTPFEAFLENMTNVASKWNGIRMLTDLQKGMSAVIVQNTILSNAKNYKNLSKANRAYMNYVNISESTAEIIAEQYAKHGEMSGSVHVANTEKWDVDDPKVKQALRDYRGALNKDVDSIITTKDVGDVPTFATTPTGRAMFQFKSFALASHQKVLLRGLQEDQARFVGGVIAMTTIGMMVTWLKAVSGNRVDKLPDFTKNPGWWIAEGVDRAGIPAIAIELSNMAEKATGFNPIKTPMKIFDEGSTISQKNQNRNFLGSIAGPTAGLVGDLGEVAGIPRTLYSGEDVSQGEKNAAERLMPWSTYVGVHQTLRYLINPQQ